MDIEKKALELWNAERAKIRCSPNSIDAVRHDSEFKALCRAIEAHELDNARHAAEMGVFRREVSQTMHFVDRELERQGFGSATVIRQSIGRFIIPQADPLVEALEEWINSRDLDDAASFRTALAARGLELVKKEPSQ